MLIKNWIYMMSVFFMLPLSPLQQSFIQPMSDDIHS